MCGDGGSGRRPEHLKKRKSEPADMRKTLKAFDLLAAWAAALAVLAGVSTAPAAEIVRLSDIDPTLLEDGVRASLACLKPDFANQLPDLELQAMLNEK